MRKTGVPDISGRHSGWGERTRNAAIIGYGATLVLGWR